MKKVYYTNARYSAIVKFQHESGAIKWIREDYLDLAQAKTLYTTVNACKGGEAHLTGQSWFWGHQQGCKNNGTIEGILLEEIKPFYFE